MLCALFGPKSQWLKFVPREGLKVLSPRGRLDAVRGRAATTSWSAIRWRKPAKCRAFDELKAKLAAEGLFDAERKAPCPPSCAGWR